MIPLEKNKTSFNSYDVDRKWDKLHEAKRTYKGMGIHKTIVEYFITNKIHRYGMISGVRL